MMKREYARGNGNLVRWNMIIVGLFFVLLTGCGGGAGQKGISSLIVDDRLTVPVAGVCQDKETGLMWQIGKSKAFDSLDAAQHYATTLRVGDHDDWRLPTIIELYGLYTTFDLQQNGACQMKVEGIYWSDEPDLEGRVGTWELDDNCDPERQYIPKQRGYVRAVRR